MYNLFLQILSFIILRIMENNKPKQRRRITREYLDQLVALAMANKKEVVIQATAMHKRVQTNASWKWGDALEIKITKYPRDIHMIFTKIDSNWSEWKVYRQFWENENIRDISFTLWLEQEHQSVDIIILDRENTWKQFPF